MKSLSGSLIQSSVHSRAADLVQFHDLCDGQAVIIIGLGNCFGCDISAGAPDCIYDGMGRGRMSNSLKRIVKAERINRVDGQT